MLLPSGARVRADNIGNIVLRTGNGSPHTMIVAPLDESGLGRSPLSRMMDICAFTGTPRRRGATRDAVLRRATDCRRHGQSRRRCQASIATPSTHLRALRDAEDEARIKTIDDIWIDLGVESRAEVEKLGVRILDSVTLGSDRHASPVIA